jgi:hypothetical protein
MADGRIRHPGLEELRPRHHIALLRGKHRDYRIRCPGFLSYSDDFSGHRPSLHEVALRRARVRYRCVKLATAMARPTELHDLACVIHLHSTYSDGTGTVPEIAEAARVNGLDAVLLTDHDTLAAKRNGEERWHGDVLVLVGEEVSPPDRDHFLAFGIDEEIPRKLDSTGICAAATERGGFGFAAHPFSKGSERFKRPGMGWSDLDCEGLSGIEVWSFVTDTAETLRSVRDAIRFVTRPQKVVDHPPELNLKEWDRLGAERRVAGIGGLDAHQIGVRVRNRVPLKLMSYRRSFRFLHTHALVEELPIKELEHDRAQIYDALREGRAYIAMDSIAPARGFNFWAESNDEALPMGAEGTAAKGWTLRARSPSPANLRLVHNGEAVKEEHATELEHHVSDTGVWRIEAHRDGRTWVLSNPVYLR